jgi:hypothetical protein
MKKRYLVCLLVLFGWSFSGTCVWAMDVQWMQKGVRVWYFGSAGTGMSSDAEEAFLFGTVTGHDIQVTTHSAINHWSSPNPVETDTYSRLDMGPCWIHPQVLQDFKVGDNWMGIAVASMNRATYTYDTFKSNGEFTSIPYLLLPIKALFDLKSQREVVKLVYGIPYLDAVWGTAYFDAETGLCLFNLKLDLSTTVFFILSEINYDFVNQKAFAEDNGPHTGFKSTALETTSMTQLVMIQSLVETRYGRTVQMWTSTQEGGGGGHSALPPNENYCFFGSVPILRHKDMTATPDYPPEQWNDYGEYLWWWVPADALQKSTINIFGVQMERTSTEPYTFTATGEGSGLYFSQIIFDNDGYMTSFYAKDPTIYLDLNLGTLIPNNQVDGLDYYKTMGTAVPEDNPNVETNETSGTDDTSGSGGGGGGGGSCFLTTGGTAQGSFAVCFLALIILGLLPGSFRKE